VPKFMLLIVSPPGAGKTHFINNRVKPRVNADRPTPLGSNGALCSHAR